MASSTSKCRIGRRLRFGSIALLLLAIEAGASAAQELPPGGGPLPQLRRGADGQIEIARPEPPAHPASGRREPHPATAAPKPAPPKLDLRGTPAAVGHTTRVLAEPVFSVIPEAPSIPDATPRGAVVASYQVRMSDGSPFTGAVRFGPPYYDGNGVFALAGNRIIVNPNGPGIGPNQITITLYFTLEAVQ